MRPNGATLRCATVLAMLGVLVGGGCTMEVDSIYGRAGGPVGAKSVNGTGVLADICRLAGHRVSSWRRLSPRLNDRADVIVWFPDDFAPPTPEARRWLEDWLLAGDDRVLIYVGRDYDAGVHYWSRMSIGAPPDQAAGVQGRLREARVRHRTARVELPTREDCDWFVLDSQGPRRAIRTLSGEKDWFAGIDAAELEIELAAQLDPTTGSEALLTSGGTPLVTRQRWGGSQLIVVANGSFLLNAALVNRQHRILADRLVGQLGSEPRKVVFLESDPGGPPIYDEEPWDNLPTALRFLTVEPLNYIVLHLAVLGLVFCFARWPIHGVGRTAPEASPTDFGRHVEALGELLARTGDVAFAQRQLAIYRSSSTDRRTESRRATRSDPEAPS